MRLHCTTTPSPVRGAVLDDQWWSMGVEAGDGYTDFVLYSGPIGYNRKHGVAKALQFSSMPYTQTYIDMEPGRVIEKEFCLELYEIEREGTGFQRPLYTSLDLYKPYDAESFADYHTIVKEKFRFAKNRWIDFGKGMEGFNMYDLSQGKSIVMGWCGQADSPGYALQLLEKELGDKDIPSMIQRSMDFLSTYPVDAETGMFPVGFNGKEFYGGDPVSCGQAMYNFAKAIVQARKTKRFKIGKWETFLRKCCDGQSRRILKGDWNPHSTAEAFLIAPLAIASDLFGETAYRQAAEKAAKTFAKSSYKLSKFNISPITHEREHYGTNKDQLKFESKRYVYGLMNDLYSQNGKTKAARKFDKKAQHMGKKASEYSDVSAFAPKYHVAAEYFNPVSASWQTDERSSVYFNNSETANAAKKIFNDTTFQRYSDQNKRRGATKITIRSRGNDQIKEISASCNAEELVDTMETLALMDYGMTARKTGISGYPILVETQEYKLDGTKKGKPEVMHIKNEQELKDRLYALNSDLAKTSHSTNEVAVYNQNEKTF